MEIADSLVAEAAIPRRIAAYIVDTAPFAVAWVVVLATTSSPTSLGRGLGIVVWLGLFIGYFAVAVARYGRTLGMAALRIRVIATHGDGNPSGRRALVRAVVQCLARPVSPLAISLPIAVVVYGPALILSGRRGLHDLAAATVVIGATGGIPA